MKKILAVSAFALLALSGCSGTTEAAPESSVTAPAPAAKAPVAPDPVMPAPAPEPVAPKVEGTVAQQNALKSAQGYLAFKGFSRSGLIKQLEFEKFSTADATWAVDHTEANWNEQAAKSAKSYLDFKGFSHAGLVKQLEFEGFTPAQAEFGVTKVGL